MVPMLTCGLLRSNFAFATAVLLRTVRCALSLCAGWTVELVRRCGWIWTEPLPARTRDAGTRLGADIPTVQGTDGHAADASGSDPIPRDMKLCDERGAGGCPRGSLSRRLGDDFLGHVRGDLGVTVEDH